MSEYHTAIVIGAGISGLVALKTLLGKKVDCVLYEATEYNGGLWHYSPDHYGVMQCTHTNVSKYNYAFSDFPFPDDCPDFPHHSQMAAYIDSYVEHFHLNDHIQHNTRVLTTKRTSNDIGQDSWTLIIDSKKGQQATVSCDYLIVATGHHAKPKIPSFKGDNNFKGTIIHSVDYKDVLANNFQRKNVVVVGIGNSAVDVATNCVERGGCKNVYLSTRSGAWVLPNYLFGQPIDLYACRLQLNNFPLKVQQMLVETQARILYGHPNKWHLNPKMGALETQPTVSATLIHQIQRGYVKIKPNIEEIMEQSVYFSDGSVAEDVDVIVLCTGYSTHLPFFQKDILNNVFDKQGKELELYKNVFCPDIGPHLAFIGFVQPPSGGILSVAEMQAQWLTMIIKRRCSLPSAIDMRVDIKNSQKQCAERYCKSSRYTSELAPITYNDEISSLFGARPRIASYPRLAHKILLGSGGVAQWSLEGPFSFEGADKIVKKVPIPMLNVCMQTVVLLLAVYFFYLLASLF